MGKRVQLACCREAIGRVLPESWPGTAIEAWRGVCMRPRTDLNIPRPEAVQILAAAYELNPDEVEYDLATVQLEPWSAVDFLQWLRDRHTWDVSTGLYYFAALERALSGKPPWM